MSDNPAELHEIVTQLIAAFRERIERIKISAVSLPFADRRTARHLRYVAEKAGKEMDPEKLMVLITQLCGALDERKLKPWQRDEPKPFAAD